MRPLSAGRGGYLTLTYGQRRSTDSASPIELADGQSREDVDFALPKGGVIDVTVVDESGEPQEGATVRAQQLRFSNGRPELVHTEQADLRQRNLATDDRGRLRLYDLPPGDYYLIATLTRLGSAPIEERDGIGKKKLLYRPTFYPGTTSLNDAQPVALALGQEVRVRIPIVTAPVARISGRVVHADGSPLTTG